MLADVAERFLPYPEDGQLTQRRQTAFVAIHPAGDPRRRQIPTQVLNQCLHGDWQPQVFQDQRPQIVAHPPHIGHGRLGERLQLIQPVRTAKSPAQLKTRGFRGTVHL